MEIAINIILLFIIGTIFGSFGGVLIGRTRDKEGIKSIFFGRSKCDKCNHTLSPLELIPIISFWIQGGKCKNCKTKLPHFYWIIEVISGLVFVATYLIYPYGDLLQLGFRLAINRGLTFLIINDIQKYELHTPLRIFTTLIATIYGIPNNFLLHISLCGLFILIFLGIYFFAKLYVKLRFKTKGEGFGMGDVYISATIGLLSSRIFTFGNIEINIINIINMLLVYIIISCLLGLIYAIIERCVSKRKDIKIPFLPAMIVGFRLLLIFGDTFIKLFI